MNSSAPSSSAKNGLNQKNAFKNAQRKASEAKGVGSRRSSRKLVPSLELFQKESCPFSHAVRNELSSLGLDYIAHNVTETLKHEQLVQAGGKDQIPFLVDHLTGVKLYESSAIIAYLQNEYGDRTAPRIMRLRDQLAHRLRGRVETLRWITLQPVERARDLRETVEDTYRLARGTVTNILEPLRALRNRMAEDMETDETEASTTKSDASESTASTRRDPMDASAA